MLALVALGEVPPAADAEHLRDCRTCRDEVASFARVVQGVRVDAPTGPPIAPAPRVWDAIAAGTGVTVAPRPERVVGADAPLPAPRTLPTDRRARGASRRGRNGGGAGPERSRLLLAVAASLIVGAAGGVLGSSLLGRDPQPPAQVVLAQVDLANLKKTAATGKAVVVQSSTGPRIRVDTSQLAVPEGGFYEVWLIDKDVKKMVGIGILHPGEDEFAVPNGVDLSQYPIVDISVEQPGDPKHSGNSVLRGTIAS
jgi:anti-sigma-K factor RskA